MGVDHDVDAVDGPAAFVVHLGVLGSDGDEDIPEHLLDFVVDEGPLDLVVLLELLDELLVLDLLEVGHLPVVHHRELRLVGRQLSPVQRVLVVRRPYPEVFVQEQRQRRNRLHQQNVTQVHLPPPSQHWLRYVFLGDFGSSLHGPDHQGKVVSDDHIHGPGHVGRLEYPKVVLPLFFPPVELANEEVELLLEVVGAHEELGVAEDSLDGVGEVVLHDDAGLEGELVEEVLALVLLPLLLLHRTRQPQDICLLQRTHYLEPLVLQVLVDELIVAQHPQLLLVGLQLPHSFFLLHCVLAVELLQQTHRFSRQLQHLQVLLLVEGEVGGFGEFVPSRQSRRPLLLLAQPIQVVPRDHLPLLEVFQRPQQTVRHHAFIQCVLRRVQEGHDLDVGVVAVRDAGPQLVIDVPAGRLVQLLRTRQPIAPRHPEYPAADLVQHLVALQQFLCEGVLVDQDASGYGGIEFASTGCLSQTPLDFFFYVYESERRVVEDAYEDGQFLFVGELVSSQGERAQVSEVLEEGDVDVEDVAVVQVQRHDLAVFSDGCGPEVAAARVLQSPLRAVTGELAVEDLHPGLAGYVLG